MEGLVFEVVTATNSSRGLIIDLEIGLLNFSRFFEVAALLKKVGGPLLQIENPGCGGDAGIWAVDVERVRRREWAGDDDDERGMACAIDWERERCRRRRGRFEPDQACAID